MAKPKQTKAYKEAVKQMTESVHRLNAGIWVGSAGPTVMPTPTFPTPAVVVQPKRKR
jgi:hypothetical protein